MTLITKKIHFLGLLLLLHGSYALSMMTLFNKYYTKHTKEELETFKLSNDERISWQLDEIKRTLIKEEQSKKTLLLSKELAH